MPWHKVKNHSACPASKPVAVIKDDGGKVVGCHPSDKAANKQLAALNASEERMMDIVERIVQGIRTAFNDVEPECEDVGRLMTRTTIQREKDDTYRWFSVSDVAARNKDGEVDSRALFDCFIRVAEATGKYPERDFMHMGRWDKMFRLGQCDFMARDGNVFITSGLYYDNELARMEIAARESNPDEWGDSIEFSLLDDPSWDGGTPVLEMGFLRFIATVPEKMAASHFTSGVVMDMEVDRMAMSEQQLEAFVQLFGDKDKARNWLEKHVDNVEDAIEEAGMMTRTVDADADVEPEPDVTTEPAQTDVEPKPDTIEREVVIDEDVIRSISDLVLAGLDEKFAPIAERLDTLDGAMEGSAGRDREMAQRLDVLEQDEGEKQQEWLEDLPKRSTLRVSRPREIANAAADVDPVTYKDRAEAATSGWDTGHYGKQQ